MELRLTPPEVVAPRNPTSLSFWRRDIGGHGLGPSTSYTAVGHQRSKTLARSPSWTDGNCYSVTTPSSWERVVRHGALTPRYSMPLPCCVYQGLTLHSSELDHASVTLSLCHRNIHVPYQDYGLPGRGRAALVPHIIIIKHPYRLPTEVSSQGCERDETKANTRMRSPELNSKFLRFSSTALSPPDVRRQLFYHRGAIASCFPSTFA